LHVKTILQFYSDIKALLIGVDFQKKAWCMTFHHVQSVPNCVHYSESIVSQINYINYTKFIPGIIAGKYDNSLGKEM